jgi:hypothetical protein
MFVKSAYWLIIVSLSLQEAHVFSTTDGMALEVFVVEGWSGDDVSTFHL